MRHKQKAAIAVALLATLVSALAAASIVGREVRAVELLALFAGGFGSGAAVTLAVVAARNARAAAALADAGSKATNGSPGDA